MRLQFSQIVLTLNVSFPLDQSDGVPSVEVRTSPAISVVMLTSVSVKEILNVLGGGRFVSLRALRTEPLLNIDRSFTAASIAALTLWAASGSLSVYLPAKAGVVGVEAAGFVVCALVASLFVLLFRAFCWRPEAGVADCNRLTARIRLARGRIRCFMR